MSKYPPLQLDSTFPFGKHKGKAVHEVLVEAPEYLLWLRSQRWASEPSDPNAGFSEQINELLDEYLENNPKLTKWYGHRYDAVATPIPEKPVDKESPREAPANWGAW